MAIGISASCQRLLLDLGLVPANCLNLEWVFPAVGPMTLRYEVYLTAEHLEKLAVVLQTLASEAKPVQDG